jgi:mono/diheme cytochrome c family protein
MKSVKFFLLLPILILASNAHADVDAVRGKLLHEQSCTGCHNTSVYSRTDKRINSLGALQGQVSRCTKPAGAEWDKQDIADVVEYLNRNYYHFK